MSIKIMSAVWQDGPDDKAEILVLLALADYCNDDGECWPSVGSIAFKARMTERGVQKILVRLVASGWLDIDPRSARRNCNLYRVKTPEPRSPRTRFTPNASAKTPNTVPKTPEPRSPKPSMNRQETSLEEANASLSFGDDLQEAVTAYNDAAKESGWPQVQLLSKTRKSALSARLMECGGLSGWKAALARAQASSHCCGKNDRGWTASFDFLTRQSSFVKLMEGNYDNRNHLSPRGSASDAASREIAFAARAESTPRDDCF